MRLAWFHPAPLTPAVEASDAVDLALELARTHLIDQFDAVRAHEFVWRHFTAPYDLTVFELGTTAGHGFVWPYLFHYPGIVVLRARTLQHSRSAALVAAHRSRELRDERTFGGAPLLRAPLMASRLVVVHDDAEARDLRDAYPGLQVRVVPIGAAPANLTGEGPGCFRVASANEPVVLRAVSRARQAGTEIAIGDVTRLSPEDVMIALEWPPTGAPPVAALRAMAAGLPVIVLETESVAAWPTLDPQTWQPRGYLRDVRPIAVSIDPRDEEHSLMLAMRRLATDRALRAQLGAAAQAWAQAHATVQAAAAQWETILREALTLAPRASGAELPSHLTEDGTAAARTVLRAFGTTVDFLDA